MYLTPETKAKSRHPYFGTFPPVPVVIVAIWRINREVEHGQSAVSGEAAPMLHALSS